MTNEDYETMYEQYLQEHGEQELPDTYEWGLY